MRIIKFLFICFVGFLLGLTLAEYFQFINLHPKFPPSEKEMAEKEITREPTNTPSIEEIPSIEADDIEVKDVIEDQNKLERMVEDRLENGANEAEENLSENNDSDSDSKENTVDNIEVEAPKPQNPISINGEAATCRVCGLLPPPDLVPHHDHECGPHGGGLVSSNQG